MSKEDRMRSGLSTGSRGKKPHQKLKPYIVLQYLLRYSDENNVIPASNIKEYLKEFCGIDAERRGIYKDIEEINAVAVMLEEECTVDEAYEILAEDESRKAVVYDKSQRGFYVRQRRFEFEDIRLLAECVYSAKFVSDKAARRLIDVVSQFVSEQQAEKLRHDAFNIDRVKTDNQRIIYDIATINEAMSYRVDGREHVPCKIRFDYMKRDINNVSSTVARRKGKKYEISPFKLLIQEGNYYLLGMNEKKEFRTFRVDRMKNVVCTQEPREGEEEFRKIDMSTYIQRTFGMFSGKEKSYVTLRFNMRLLDTAVERFGARESLYTKVDDRHFTVRAEVEISDQFFGWLLGFGKSVKILWPERVVDEFKEYMDKVREMYESDEEDAES